MITGAHAILYSSDPDADRAFLRDVLRLPNLDAGGGWLIFALPPSEVAVHPGEVNGRHELFLLCDDVEAFLAEMKKRGVACGPIQEPRWGRLTQVTLPGGGTLGVYEPRHARPPQPRATRSAARSSGTPKRARSSKKAAKKARVRR